MQRRKFVIALGSIAAGGAALMGTGAFTSATIADRGFTAEVSADDTALLGLEPTSPYASIGSDEKLVLQITNLNADSQFSFADLFVVRNNGTEPISVAMDVSGTPALTDAIESVESTGGADSGTDLLDDSTPVDLGSGQGVSVGVTLSVGDDDAGSLEGGFSVKTV